MNSARKRRPLIRARALEGMLWRIGKEIKVKCEHGILRNGILCEKCHPILTRPETVRATVTLDDEYTGVGKDSRLTVDLPIDNLAQTALGMYYYGFWQKRENTMIFIPPHHIIRIMVWGDENGI